VVCKGVKIRIGLGMSSMAPEKCGQHDKDLLRPDVFQLLLGISDGC